jgi:hypothetical protein
MTFSVSFAFCAIAVRGAERKKGTAKEASSHRTPKKANRPVGNKNRYVPRVQNWAKTVQAEHAEPVPFFIAIPSRLSINWRSSSGIELPAPLACGGCRKKILRWHEITQNYLFGETKTSCGRSVEYNAWINEKL